MGADGRSSWAAGGAVDLGRWRGDDGREIGEGQIVDGRAGLWLAIVNRFVRLCWRLSLGCAGCAKATARKVREWPAYYRRVTW